jgi:hypothetical protein
VVTSHNKAGVALVPATDDLLVAYANYDAVIDIEGKTPGTVPNRDDSTIKVIIKDQSISSSRDTIYTTLSCSESHDVVQTVTLVETTNTSGIYISTVISKTEGSAVNDGTLQCNSRDKIKVTYKDPVYGDVKELQVLFDAPITDAIRSFANKRLNRIPNPTMDFSGCDAKGRRTKFPAHPGTGAAHGPEKQ